MTSPLTGLRLAATTPIDLQLHTTHSDGTWTAEQLLDHLSAAQFGLAAITDHDRPDSAAQLQTLAAARHFPLLVAVEMTAMWHGELTDFLCYGFDPHHNALAELAQDVARRQHANTRQVFQHLREQGYPVEPPQLDHMLAQPAAQQLPALLALATQVIPDAKAIGRTLLAGGFAYMTHDPATIVAAAHHSGAVCILAHPGRSDGFVCYDEARLDALRASAPIDGIEAHYPAHTPEQTAAYLDYAQRHGLLTTAGSDSHGPNKPPIPYPAHLCRDFLARLGISVG